MGLMGLEDGGFDGDVGFCGLNDCSNLGGVSWSRLKVN